VVKARLVNLLLIAAACGIGVFLWLHFFPNEEKRIRKCLDGLAEAVSFSAGGSLAATAVASERLRDLLAPEVAVDVEMPGGGHESMSGRAEIVQAAMGVRQHLRGLKVEFLDVQIQLEPDDNRALCSLTAKATQPGDRDFVVQEMKLEFVKQDGQWRLLKAAAIRTLKL
jgi:hypothetical protein